MGSVGRIYFFLINNDVADTYCRVGAVLPQCHNKLWLNVCFLGPAMQQNYISNTVRPNRKLKYQDGGLQTGSACVLASVLDSHVILTAIPVFLGIAIQQNRWQYCATKPEAEKSRWWPPNRK